MRAPRRASYSRAGTRRCRGPHDGYDSSQVIQTVNTLPPIPGANGRRVVSIGNNSRLACAEAGPETCMTAPP